MDTRYWGPDAWDLLHFISLDYPNNPSDNDKLIYSHFFNSLPFVLPCFYCRSSFTDYLKELPIENYFNSKKNIIEWVWKLHNKVNDKLRKQKLISYPNPPLSIIKTQYLPRLNDINSMDCANMTGWKFIYSILFTFKNELKTIEFKRFAFLQIFLTSLSYILPFPKIKLLYNHFIYKNPINSFIFNPNKLINWFYKFEKLSSKHTVHICPELETRELVGDKYKTKCGHKEDLVPTCRVKDIEDIQEH